MPCTILEYMNLIYGLESCKMLPPKLSKFSKYVTLPSPDSVNSHKFQNMSLSLLLWKTRNNIYVLNTVSSVDIICESLNTNFG